MIPDVVSILYEKYLGNFTSPYESPTPNLNISDINTMDYNKTKEKLDIIHNE